MARTETPQTPQAPQTQQAGESAVTRSPTQTRPQQDRPAQRVTFPCDVYENDHEYLLIADMPGLETEQCDLVIRGDRLEIRGSRTMDEEPILYERTFTMPHNADTKEITASYKDGVVRVTIAKTQESRPRKIQVHG
jgi:HSP20 family protein